MRPSRRSGCPVADPHAIVIVPTEAGAVLLASCVLARPPSGWKSWRGDGGAAGGGHQGPTRELDAVDGEPPIVAVNGRDGLPLWWNGAPVPDGVFRAWNAWTAGVSRPAPCPVRPDCAEVLELAKELERVGLCRVALLDLVGGALVERAS